MGNSDQKQQKSVQKQQLKKQQENLNQKKSQPYPIINSGRSTNNHQNNNHNQPPLKNKKQKHKNRSPPFQNIHNKQAKNSINTIIPNKKSSNIFDTRYIDDQNREQNHDDEEEDFENQFLPMLALPKEGSTSIIIKIRTITPSKNPKPCVRNNFSQYKSTMNWKVNQQNIYQFNIEGQSIKLDVDLQGNILNRQYDIWAMVCPLDIVFGQRFRVGQYKCSHYYSRLSKYQQQQEQQQQISPYMKSIQLGLDNDLFYKWDQKIPQQMYNKNKKFQKLSRYFDNNNNWKASVYIQETYREMKIWVIQIDEKKLNQKLSKLILADINKRQQSYIHTMYKKMNYQ